MKYIIIKGSRSSGKATTINEVCRRLNPEKIRKLYFSEKNKVFLETISQKADISDGTYIITVRKKNILVVSESPTEQRKRITSIMNTIINLQLSPDFAIVATRGLERLQNFSTCKELQNFGKCIYETKIWRIPSNMYNLTDEWNKRVSYITAITLHNL